MDLRPPSPAPVATLVRATDGPLNLAMAAARTCYAGRVITPQDVSATPEARAQRDRIARSTLEAGHHTVHQHAHFTFALERVSRLAVWGFLHAHPFYNSEQVSQRYVEVKPGRFAVPALAEPLREIFVKAVEDMHATYAALVEELTPAAAQAYFRVFPARQRHAEQYAGEIKKRAQEVARYALPVATHAHLYHSVSALTLLRYRRTCQQVDVPGEAVAVVDAMVAAVRAVDGELLELLQDPLPLEETPEFATLRALGEYGTGDGGAFCREFDGELGGRISKLVLSSPQAETVVAQAVRETLGLTRNQLDDDTALARVLDPAHNPLLADPLGVDTLTKLPRALHHASYTFQKKLSHTADSQDQRHRLTPASRPVLARQVELSQVDVVLPELLKQVPAAVECFQACMARVWSALRQLAEGGAPASAWSYLLPNAFPVRFTESGDLMALHHKWTTRLCFTAQEEIWRASKEEVEQVRAVHPRIGQHLGPPCALRLRAGQTPLCPEGPRYCGVPVWKQDVADYLRVL